jgi:hypothetical protein
MLCAGGPISMSLIALAPIDRARGRLEIDDQEFGRLFDGELGRRGAL